ncbi:MAG: quinone-dependent dihydroorotate dehydrogenase [Thiotrichales bacterium]
MYDLLRSLLFLLPPEVAHAVALRSLHAKRRLRDWANHEIAPIAGGARHVMGLNFANPIGLAAGMDKNGDFVDALGGLGFGFVEVGTVTPRPQPGNRRPRLFRLPQAEALINRMGFNNKGVEYLIEKVHRRRYAGVLGINIGKNFDTPLDRAVDDYLLCLKRVYAAADYVVLNVSSPNTPGLRRLQSGLAMKELLSKLKREQLRLARHTERYVPLLVKVAPDLVADELIPMADTINELQIDGVVATNTTNSRDMVAELRHGQETGGLSGRPLFERSTEVLRAFRNALEPGVALIAAGGVMGLVEARAKLAAGADLIQVYTGLVYSGPDLVRELVYGLEGGDANRSRVAAVSMREDG